MFKKSLLLALAFAGLSFGTLQALSLSGLTGTMLESFVECTGGGSESFTNIPASSSAYATRTWTGDNGVAWSATDARTDQTLTGKAIALRTSTLKNTVPVTGGVGTLTFDYKRVFTGNSTLKVFVNGVQYGADITVSSETPATFSQAINISGNVTIEIKNSGNRTIVDNVAWNCYENVVLAPELQLADASSVNQSCGDFTLDFGSHSVDVYQDAVFNVKNTGTSTLTVTALNLSNSTDFTIISPSIPFNVTAGSSAIVLVRFDAVTGGEKTSTLTIVNNDATEGSCVIDLVGVGLEPCVAPVVTEGEIAVSDITSSTADASVTAAVADSYLAVVTTTGVLSALPSDTVNYAVNDSLGGGVVAYVGDLADFTMPGLAENTSYTVYVFPYNNTDCTGGPLYNTEYSIKAAFTTLVAPCIGGSETFTNMPASSSAYAVRTWTGDNGIAWTATDARTDLTHTGRALGIRLGSLTNTTPVSGGIGTLSFNYKRVFTNNSVLKVFVNGVQYGGDITVSSDTATLFSQAINVSGDVTVEIENSGNRTIIDDITWDCYSTPNTPEIQLLDEAQAPKACGNFTVDLGTPAVNTTAVGTFTIKNLGALDLEIGSITISDTINYTIVSPIAPATVDSLGTVDVLVQFNSAVTGSFPAVLTISSNDADEASCTVNFLASAQEECVAPVVSTGDIIVSEETPTSIDVEVQGATAGGYIAIISAGGTITPPVSGTEYEVNDVIGSGVVAYVGTASLFTLLDLDPNTTYTIFVYGYNSADCLNGPAYSEVALETTGTTSALPCTGGTETFTNMPANASAYATRTWTGDNGVAWSATDARTDQTLTGRAIAFRVGTLENTSLITGGIGTLTFNYKRVFTGNSTLKVFVNGVQYGADIVVSSETPAIYSEVINVAADATIELVNTGNRIVVDDLAWDCYSGSSAKPAFAPASTKEAGVYPNPSNGQFQIDLVTETADVIVYNTIGKEVLNKKVSDNEVINLDRAEAGIYMVVITEGGSVTTKKVVIK
jgi:hypothetical protein